MDSGVGGHTAVGKELSCPSSTRFHSVTEPLCFGSLHGGEGGEPAPIFNFMGTTECVACWHRHARDAKGQKQHLWAEGTHSHLRSKNNSFPQ